MCIIIRPRATEAERAACCECLNQYIEGKRDCQIIDCPLYIHQPWRKHAPNLEWIFGQWQRNMISRWQASGLSKEKFIQTEIIKNKKSIRLSRRQIFKAKCFRCIGEYSNPKELRDCRIRDCPLYYWMPYRQLEPDYNWIFDSKYTSVHRTRLISEGLSRQEYIKKYLGTKKRKFHG